MRPIICTIGPFTVFSYGLMLAIAALVCGPLFAKAAAKKGVPKDAALDFVFCVMLFGILGARLFFIFLNLSYFLQNPVEIIMLQHGGLAWQGGLIAGTVSAIIFTRRRQLKLWLLLDTIAPYLALGQAIGRIGCLLNGCCYGRPVSWGLFFPAHGARLHPTQIYMSLSLLVLFFILNRWQHVLKKPGEMFAAYLLGAATFRFVIQFFRYDYEPVVFGLSIFHLVCLGIMGAAVYVLSRSKD